MSKVAELIKEIAGTPEESIHVCKVISVEGATCNVEPLSGTAELHGVRLNCVTANSAGIIITPKLNSEVIVHQISKVDSYVAQYSEIEKIDIEIGAFKLSFNANEMVFNEGTVGLAKSDILVSKYNALEQDVNALKQLFSTWAPVLQDGGTALKTILTSWMAQPIAPTTISEIADTKIKH